MRQHTRLNMRIPKRLKNNPQAEVAFFVRKYRQSKTREDRKLVLKTLMKYGSRYDVINRSILYGMVERNIGVRFPVLWGCYKDLKPSDKHFESIETKNFDQIFGLAK